MTPAYRLRIETKRTPLVEKTAALFTRALAERAGLAVTAAADGASPADLTLTIGPGPGTDGFAIAPDGRGGWTVTGHDERGLLYGVGRFLHNGRFAFGAFTPGTWQGTDVPRLAVRGMYFATHFHNFYHDAPLEAVCRYVEDLALWGCNALTVWFDMHHYTGTDDPAAQAMIRRLHAILHAANGVGMGAGLLVLANEAYSTSPVSLRAEPFPHHYHVEVCPTRPGGLDLILKWRRETFAAFADLNLEHFWIWPYDQGGCKCPDCKPWGGNGFVRNAEAVGRLARQVFPRAKTIISTWEFGYWEGDPEWARFYEVMAGAPDWADYIMAEGHGDFPPYVLQHGKPGGLPLLNFPEISMSGMSPWGGFGANLQPARLQKVWTSCAPLLSGGFPYSEGIFEDLNKVVCLQLYWNPARSVKAIVRDYAAAEADPAVADDVAQAVYRLEQNMNHGFDTQAAAPYRMPAVREPQVPFDLLDGARRRLVPAAQAAWRWRLLWLRAALDLELTRSGGQPTDLTDGWFDEISLISHADGADWSVCIPGRRRRQRMLRDENAGWQLPT